MRIAALQHRLRESAAQDVDALVASARNAAEAGAELVVFPEVLSIGGDASEERQRLYELLDAVPGQRLIPNVGAYVVGFGLVSEPLEAFPELGKIAMLVGDSCMTGVELIRMLGDSPSVALMAPRSESDLQAEAVLELALGLSESLAGLVIVSECCGSDPGDIGHGGSAIIHLGKMLAEALGDDDELLIVDIDVPIEQPEPREALPAIPPILTQRTATHRGEKPEVDYPADLS